MSTTTERRWPESWEKTAGWTAKFPRPTEDDGVHPAVLAVRLKEWDDTEALRVRFAKKADEIRAAREAKERSEREKQQAAQEARQQAKRDETEALLKRRFRSAGGSEADWAKEKDAVIAAHRRRQIAQAETDDDRARQAHAALYRTF